MHRLYTQKEFIILHFCIKFTVLSSMKSIIFRFTKEPINIIPSYMNTTNLDSTDIDRGYDVISNPRH